MARAHRWDALGNRRRSRRPTSSSPPKSPATSPQRCSPSPAASRSPKPSAGARLPEAQPAASLLAGRLPRERSRVLAVRVVVVPPLVRRGLRVALGRVLPLLLASERGDVEIAPGGAYVL